MCELISLDQAKSYKLKQMENVFAYDEIDTEVYLFCNI